MAHSEATTKFDPAMHRVVGAAITDLEPEKDWVVGVAIADFDPKDYGVGCLSLHQHDAVARCTNIHDPAAEIGWAYGHVGLRGPGWFPANYCLFARAATTTTSIRGTASSSSSSSVGAAGAATAAAVSPRPPPPPRAYEGPPAAAAVSPRPPPPPPMVDLNGHAWLQAVQFLDSVDHNGFPFVFRAVGLSLLVDVHPDNTFYVQLRVRELHHDPTEREFIFGLHGAHISIGTYRNNSDEVNLTVNNLRPQIRQHERLGGSISLKWNRTVGMRPTVLDLRYCSGGGSIDVLVRRIDLAFRGEFQSVKCPKRMLDCGGSNFHFSVYSAEQV